MAVLGGTLRGSAALRLKVASRQAIRFNSHKSKQLICHRWWIYVNVCTFLTKFTGELSARCSRGSARLKSLGFCPMSVQRASCLKVCSDNKYSTGGQYIDRMFAVITSLNCVHRVKRAWLAMWVISPH